jgi:signal transduction histidine kinase
VSKDRIYAWAIVASTAVAFAGLYAGRELDSPAPSTFAFWILLLLAVELLPVSLGFGTVTMGFPIYLAVAITFEPWVAMAIAGLGALDVREFRREIQLHHALFNRCQLMLSVGVASWVFNPFGIDVAEIASTAAGVTLAAAAYTATNLALVSLWIAFREGVSWMTALRGLIPKPAGGFWISYLLLAGLGTASAIVYREIEFGAFFVALFLIPVLFARLSIQGARAQVELSERIRHQQQALLDATEKVFYERESERKRIAAEIHDSSLQMLAAAAYGMANARTLMEAGRAAEGREMLDGATKALDGAMAGLRQSLSDLRKSSVEEGGLMETMKKFADQASTLWGVGVNIEGEISSEPPLPVALAAFQILQEGLTNSLKHAKDSAITVKVEEEAGMVRIVVEDQGPGFDPSEEVDPTHVGMRLMNERAERVGGEIRLDSRPGSGTRLEAILPGGVAK